MNIHSILLLQLSFGLCLFGTFGCKQKSPGQQVRTIQSDGKSFSSNEFVHEIAYASFGYSDAAKIIDLMYTRTDIEQLRSDLRTIQWSVVGSRDQLAREKLVWQQIEVEVDPKPTRQFINSIREIAQQDTESEKQCIQLLSLLDSVYASVLLSSDSLVQTPTRSPLQGSGAIQQVALWRLGLQAVFDEFGSDAERYLLTQEQRDYLMAVSKAGQVKDLKRVP